MIIADIGEIAPFKNFQIISIKCLLIFIFFIGFHGNWQQCTTLYTPFYEAWASS